MNASVAMHDVLDDRRLLTIIAVGGALESRPVVLLRVRDHGRGIAPDQLHRLFEAFFTTKTRGMGMGLRISRSIVEAHGGRLWASPNDGPGLTLHCALPIA
jgi:signal transduction histidine kinase